MKPIPELSDARFVAVSMRGGLRPARCTDCDLPMVRDPLAPQPYYFCPCCGRREV